MLTAQQNTELTRVGPGTPMGELLRRYWYPVAFTRELEEFPVRPARLLGEDFAVFKTTHFTERMRLQFRAEFFNLLNRANFSSPTANLTVFDQTGNAVSSAGLITSTQTTSRQIQFALKVIW